LNDILNLRIIRVLEHLNDLNEPLFRFLAGDNHLEDANRSTSLALPKFRVRIESLKNVEGLNRVIELAHLIAIVSYQIEQTKRLI
jgi:hypothetical protein